MPIKFRCPHCRQFLGISRSKAGALTDCPTCGRTIRIPDLDGSVKPLPGPEFNLGDSELAGALDALARLDAPERRETASRSAQKPATPGAEKPESMGVAVHAGDIRDLDPAPAAEPIPVEPALPAEPAVSRGHGAASSDQPATVRASTDPLDELIRLNPADAVAEPPPRRTGSRRSAVVLLAAGAVLFALGVVTGRWTAPGPDPAERADDDSSGHSRDPTASTPAETVPAEPDVELVPALSGRLTYASDGDIEPDLAARVIVFPKEREGTARLPVVGFRAGAAPADQALARTSIRALGGDYTTTDDQGRYTVRLAAAGEYHVLFLSRFQPRDEAGFLEPALQQKLSRYFDRPAALIGPVAYKFDEFTFRGDVAIPRDHVFEQQ